MSFLALASDLGIGAPRGIRTPNRQVRSLGAAGRPASSGKGALRHETWCAASQSRGLVNLPRDAALEQQAQAEVDDVWKPCPTHLIFLMGRLIASVGALEQPPVEWKVRISASHGPDRAG